MSVLTISSFIPQVSWPHGGSTATLRIKYSGDFVDSAGQQVLRGLHKDVACTIAAGVLTVPQFTLITTNDAQVNPLVTCSAQFFDSNASARDWLFQQFSIPESLTPTTNIGALAVYNLGISLVLPPDFYLNRDEVTSLALNLIAITTPALHASTHQNGGTDEITVTGLSGLLADGQTPLAHKTSHQNGGSDEILVTGLSGLLADGQTPLAHAASHQNGGADEISVVGLSGLLADGQTPLGHAASHESGGSDAVKLDNLAAPDDNTDLNASITAHGLLPKLSNNAAQFLNGVGAFATPAGAGDVVGPATATNNGIVRFDTTTGKLVQDSNLTLPDDAASTEVGYMNIPQNSKSADYTAVIADRGWHLFHPVGDNNARTFTIPANASVAFVIGTAITFVNKINVLSIAITSDTLTWAEDGSTGTRALAANGIATALKITSTEWLISGVGLS